jgi:galactose mutarotase-like enzyme
MVYNLNSDILSVSINSKGAEIASVKRDGIEYIWQAKPEVWPRYAPVLFPIVGKLKNGSLPQHGFARDREFTCISQSETAISFSLNSDDETKKLFPYEFNLAIKYSIKKDVIICAYEVTNPSSGNLFFSIGAHPGFATPDQLPNYVLKFKANKPYEITLLSNGFLTESKERFHIHNGETNLNSSLFDKDALVFENAQIDLIELVSTKSGRGVELSCKGWPYFGIWSKTGCNDFVCLEPWHGITDAVEATADLSQKKGIIKLEAGKKFLCSFSMRFF